MAMSSRPPKLWRVRGRASDGLMVTLGRYETLPEAQADLDRLKREGRYGELDLQAIEAPDVRQPPV